MFSYSCKFKCSLRSYPPISFHEHISKQVEEYLKNCSKRKSGSCEVWVDLWNRELVSTEFLCEKLDIDYDKEQKRVASEKKEASTSVVTGLWSEEIYVTVGR
jgi:hypothetical protein